MESAEYHHLLSLLHWQVELGATETIQDMPVNRYDLPKAQNKAKAQGGAGAQKPGVMRLQEPDAEAEAQKAAAAARSLDELRAAVEAFTLCDLKKGARRTVFSDGIPGARVMVVGEAPDREEDRAGRSFVGAAGGLLDRMFGAIGLGRDREEAPLYLTSVLPWRLPRGRDAQPEEIAMMRPFLLRHIALAQPEVLVIMGNGAAQSLLGKRGLSRLRGKWDDVAGIKAMPMFHPATLLRKPAMKRVAWGDLLEIKARLGDG